jgi:hypothetical protein
MTHFLKTIMPLFIITLLCTSARHNSAMAATAEESLEARIRTATTLQKVLETGEKEYARRRKTWESLKDGEDDDAKQRSTAALQELYGWIAVRCGELTGLTPEWSTGQLRARKGFFEEASTVYEDFRNRLVSFMNTQSQSGMLKTSEGGIYGKVLAWAGQRAAFYRACFSWYAADTSCFEASGFGPAVAKFSHGFIPSSPWLGEYYDSINTRLALLAVQKEEVKQAQQLVTLLEKFHEPLGITEKIQYGPYAGSAFVEKRESLEGDLPLERVRAYLADESFWKGVIPEELKKKPAE